MGILLSLWILIKVYYPSNNIEDIRMYNSAIDKAMKQYCFLDVEYEICPEASQADLLIYPVDVRLPSYTLGLTFGSYVRNPKIYGVPNIHLNIFLNSENLPIVLTHELGHFFGLDHSIDPKSLMYPETDWTNIQLTRHDSITLLKLYNIKY